jgi:hypothetical protein
MPEKIVIKSHDMHPIRVKQGSDILPQPDGAISFREHLLAREFPAPMPQDVTHEFTIPARCEHQVLVDITPKHIKAQMPQNAVWHKISKDWTVEQTPLAAESADDQLHTITFKQVHILDHNVKTIHDSGASIPDVFRAAPVVSEQTLGIDKVFEISGHADQPREAVRRQYLDCVENETCVQRGPDLAQTATDVAPIVKQGKKPLPRNKYHIPEFAAYAYNFQTDRARAPEVPVQTRDVLGGSPAPKSSTPKSSTLSALMAAADDPQPMAAPSTGSAFMARPSSYVNPQDRAPIFEQPKRAVVGREIDESVTQTPASDAANALQQAPHNKMDHALDEFALHARTSEGAHMRDHAETNPADRAASQVLRRGPIVTDTANNTVNILKFNADLVAKRAFNNVTGRDISSMRPDMGGASSVDAWAYVAPAPAVLGNDSRSFPHPAGMQKLMPVLNTQKSDLLHKATLPTLKPANVVLNGAQLAVSSEAPVTIGVGQIAPLSPVILTKAASGDGGAAHWQVEQGGEFMAGASGYAQIAAPMPAKPQPILPYSLAASVWTQVVSAVRHTPTDAFQIQLSPSELGKLRITMLTMDGGMQVSIMAERIETLELLRKFAAEFERDLINIGYQHLNMTFSHHNASNIRQFEADAKKEDEDETKREAILDSIRFLPIEAAIDGMDIRM